MSTRLAASGIAVLFLRSTPSMAQSGSESDRDGNDPFDESGWSARLGGGLVTTSSDSGGGEEVDFDEAFMLAVAFGHHFGAGEERLGFDVELEGLWSDQDAETSGEVSGVRDYTAVGLLLNGVVDFRLVDRWFLYGGAGIGTSFVDIGSSGDEFHQFDSEDGPFLTWQGKAGVRWNMTDRLAWNLGYRFVNISDVEIQDSIGASNFELGIEQHVIELGISFGF